ncbi:MAG: LysE family translocator [Anaerolineae bacterium]|nr:LysE family translocator [Anaerolineae bacterium]
MELNMPSNFSLFLTATLVLLLTPGPAVLYVIARSIDQGRKAGLVSVLGLALGTLFHVFAAAMGLSALLLSSALAFNLVKYLGAAYLIYLGVQRLLSKEEVPAVTAAQENSLSRAFSQGVVVNFLNPKTALFFFAFLPQFVDSSTGSVTLQFLMLGIIFVLLAVCTDGLYALFAGTLGRWLRGNLQFLRLQRYFAGWVYIGLGLTTALAGTNKK